LFIGLIFVIKIKIIGHLLIYSFYKWGFNIDIPVVSCNIKNKRRICVLSLLIGQLIWSASASILNY